MTVVQMVIVGMILIILATVTLALLSYGAFKVRDRRSKRGGGHSPHAPADDAPMFFERVRIAPPAQDG